ncbi:adenosylmethionine decarboxylase [Jannaschia aquimarina]|uniref:S-adenosylmethionine decarboxylase proenzyme n=1 Tax=Jannaschia aquimarina TaxID=935700 RepID=A0A0D1EDY5_9RHOB|nr:adenosylmethionine decarboxylase [Jannaschia aquimarina]KIT15141.1 S-adenosylmethionine decarboxylase proenzyme precursor [Jannaschia aquimarina]SNS65227.1 S-adenosylmethionine decarboxylase [Jannaschia aquimarina]
MKQVLEAPIVAACGRHLLADFHGATNLFDGTPAAEIFRQAAEAAGATVLDTNFHDFGQRAGFTGVAILAESHISIHTWPEVGYAAIDIFMCGDCDPRVALDHLSKYFRPSRTELRDITRGAPNAVAIAS